MALRNFKGISNAMSEIRQILISYAVDLNNWDSYYSQLVNNASDTFRESRESWAVYSEKEKRRISKEAGNILSQIDVMMDSLLGMEKQLCQVDKSYAKRREAELSMQTGSLTMSLDNNTDYLALMKSLSCDAKKIAEECSLTVRAQPIQELGMLFSGRRRQMYSKLYDLILDGKKIRDCAFDVLQQRVVEQKERITEKCDIEIDKAAAETAELIQSIETAHSEKSQFLYGAAKSALDAILSRDEIDTIIEMGEMLRATYDNLPENCSEFVALGWYKVPLDEIIPSPTVVALANEKLSGTIDGYDFSLPAIVDLREGLHYSFEPDALSGDSSKRNVHSVMFSLLRNAPASRQSFILFDPENRAKGFDLYLDFIKKHAEIMGGHISTTQAQMRNEIDKLSNFVDEIGQTRFVGFSDIFDYNASVSDKQEPLKCLCILNFPKYFDDHMLDGLYNIIKNGAEYGVQVLIQYDEQFVDRRHESFCSAITRISQACTKVCCSGGYCSLDKGVMLALSATPSVTELQRFDIVFSEQYSTVKSAVLPINRILSRNDWFSGYSANGISIPIGKNEDGAIQCLEVGDSVANGTSHYALIVGSTGSGKSTLLHTLIMNAITKYSPDELNLYLMDFKSGTEFKIYAEYGIPHIKLLALDAMQEFGQSILDELWSIMQDRIVQFKAALQNGFDIKDLRQYREMTGRKMPRILVIADEFQLLFSEDNNRKVANVCGMRMADFVSLARVYGIHFVFSTQTMSRLSSGFSIRKATMSEMHVRIGLQCTETEAGLVFGDTFGKSAFAKMGSEKGSAVYTENDVRAIPIGFKVAFCDKDTQRNILEEVQKQYSLMESNGKMQVFEGDKIPSVISCPAFMNPDPKESLNMVPIFLGEPIKIAPPLQISVNRMKRNNLLICGGNHELLDRITALYLLNAIKSKPHKLAAAQNKAVYLCDGLTITGEAMCEQMRKAIVYSAIDVKVAQNNTDVLAYIDELYAVYEKRRFTKLHDRNRHVFSAVHLILNDLQWIDAVNLMLSNKSIDEYSRQRNTSPATAGNELFSFVPQKTHPNDLTAIMDDLINQAKTAPVVTAGNVSYHKKIMALIESGYSYGINVVISCADLVSIKEYMYEVIPKFQHRIIFALSNNDADRLIPDAKTETLKSNIVIYTDGINQTYQFKPYCGIDELSGELLT